MQQERYVYRNLPIPGGGYVTGFIFHQTGFGEKSLQENQYIKEKQGIFYIRTDIGGTYRFEPAQERFVSLIDHVTMKDLSETFPIAVAVDDKYPERLYIACGVNREGAGGAVEQPGQRKTLGADMDIPGRLSDIGRTKQGW